MLIALLVFDVLLMGLTMFTTQMVEHKFKNIQMGLEMYCSKRTYKTKADIEFIEGIIEEYKRLCSDTDEEPDLPSAISLKLHKEFIGRFSYVGVKNVAIKARHLMWGIWVGEILIAWVNQVTNEGQTLLIWSVSLFLTLIMCFYGIIKGLDEKQDALIDEVTHYIKNVYPLEVQKQSSGLKEGLHLVERSRHEKKGLVADLNQLIDQESINEKQKTHMQNQPITKSKPAKKKEVLSADDIAQMLKNL